MLEGNGMLFLGLEELYGNALGVEMGLQLLNDIGLLRQLDLSFVKLIKI